MPLLNFISTWTENLLSVGMVKLKSQPEIGQWLQEEKEYDLCLPVPYILRISFLNFCGTQMQFLLSVSSSGCLLQIWFFLVAEISLSDCLYHSNLIRRMSEKLQISITNLFPTTAELSDVLSRPGALIMQVKNLDESFCSVFPSLYMCFLLWGIQRKEKVVKVWLEYTPSCKRNALFSSINLALYCQLLSKSN